MTTEIPGILEIDNNRGVIYFHNSQTGMTVLRVCRLPPVPDVNVGDLLDITMGHGVSWSREAPTGELEPEQLRTVEALRKKLAELDSEEFENILWFMSGLVNRTWRESGDEAFQKTRDLLMEASAAVHNRSGN